MSLESLPAPRPVPAAQRPLPLHPAWLARLRCERRQQMRNKLFIVLVGLAAAVLLPAQAFAGKPPKPVTADPEVAFLSSLQKIAVANADGGNVTTIASTKWGRFHAPLMFPNRRAVLYSLEEPLGTARSLRMTQFGVSNGVITVGATEVLLQLGQVADFALSPDGSRVALFDPAAVPPDMKIMELEIATGVIRHLFDVPSGHDLHHFGGYTFDSSALVLIPYDLTDPDLTSYDSIMVIDLDASGVGVGAWDALDLAGWGNKLMGIEPAKASREVLFDAMNVLYILNLDTLSLTTVGRGHMGTWAPDDSAILYIDMPQNNTWTVGPAFEINLVTGEISAFTRPNTYISVPNWR